MLPWEKVSGMSNDPTLQKSGRREKLAANRMLKKNTDIRGQSGGLMCVSNSWTHQITSEAL